MPGIGSPVVSGGILVTVLSALIQDEFPAGLCSLQNDDLLLLKCALIPGAERGSVV